MIEFQLFVIFLVYKIVNMCACLLLFVKVVIRQFMVVGVFIFVVEDRLCMAVILSEKLVRFIATKVVFFFLLA